MAGDLERQVTGLCDCSAVRCQRDKELHRPQPVWGLGTSSGAAWVGKDVYWAITGHGTGACNPEIEVQFSAVH